MTSQTYLLVDDALIARRQGVVRRAHACRKLAQPVLTPQKPWEGNRLYVYGTVLRDQAGGFRLWYMSNLGLTMYATSPDGLNWQRPELGIRDYEGSRANNIVYAMECPSVVIDPLEADVGKRYKMLGYVRKVGYHAAYSPDGLNWSAYPRNPVLTGDDTCTMSRDPQSGQFLLFHKLARVHNEKKRRLVYSSVSRDMQEWSPSRLALAPDEMDDRQTQAEGGLHSHFCNLSAFPWAGQWLGLVTHFRNSRRLEEASAGQSRDDGPIDVQLVHSRDGRDWHRCEDRSPVIPNAPYPYDAGCILGVANGPVIVGDEGWIYYTAINTTHGGALPEKKVTIAAAVWRVDGWVSLSAGPAGGIIQTVPLEAAGQRLVVNANAARGELCAAVADPTGRPLDGYAMADCRPVHGDHVRQAVAWKGRPALPRRGRVSLRLQLSNADLFSYSLLDPL